MKRWIIRWTDDRLARGQRELTLTLEHREQVEALLTAIEASERTTLVEAKELD